MVAVPEVGGNIPVNIDLREREDIHVDVCMYACEHSIPLKRIHGGGFSCSVVSQKGSNLALVEVDAEAVHSRCGGTAEYFDQVLDANSLHQICWL